MDEVFSPQMPVCSGVFQGSALVSRLASIISTFYMFVDEGKCICPSRDIATFLAYIHLDQRVGKCNVT